jgi:hypothetical protein
MERCETTTAIQCVWRFYRENQKVSFHSIVCFVLLNAFHSVTLSIRYCVVDSEVGEGAQCEHLKFGPITDVIQSNHWSCNPLVESGIFFFVL